MKVVELSIRAIVTGEGERCRVDYFRYCNDISHWKMSHDRCNPDYCGHCQTLSEQVRLYDNCR